MLARPNMRNGRTPLSAPISNEHLNAARTGRPRAVGAASPKACAATSFGQCCRPILTCVERPLCNPDGVAMLAGPGAHRTKWLVERTAEIDHPILNAGRRAIDEPPLDDAVAFQSSQALGQRLLRETVHLTAKDPESRGSETSAHGTNAKCRPGPEMSAVWGRPDIPQTSRNRRV